MWWRGAGAELTLQVPYIGMRSFCAIMGSITVPIVYAIMRESGYPIAISLFTASLVMFGEYQTSIKLCLPRAVRRLSRHHAQC